MSRRVHSIPVAKHSAGGLPWFRARRCCSAAVSSAVRNARNNTCCQDNEVNWFDWSAAERQQGLVRLVQHLTQLRRAYPILRRRRFLTGERDAELNVKGVTAHRYRGALRRCDAALGTAGVRPGA
jgi:hypothetical protein